MNPPPQCYLEGFLAGARARGDGGNGRLLEGVPGVAAVAENRPALSFEEQVKKDLHPAEALPRLLEYAGANRPPDRADAFRFRWFGLHYLAPAKDGFRLRVRVPGGRLQAFQLRGLADVARNLASGEVRLNVNGGVDLEAISIWDAPEALQRLAAVGLGTRGSGGDCLRAVINQCTDAVPWSLVHPSIYEIEQRTTHGRELVDLPRGCLIRFRGPEIAHKKWPASGPFDQASEITLQAADFPAGSQRSKIAWRLRWSSTGDLGVWVEPEQVAHTCMALLRLWRKEADRSNRTVAALTTFCGSRGASALLKAMEPGLPFELTRSPAPAPMHGQGAADADHSRANFESEETFATRTATLPSERLSSGQLNELAHLADTYAQGTVRLAPDYTVTLVAVHQPDVSVVAQALHKVVAVNR